MIPPFAARFCARLKESRLPSSQLRDKVTAMLAAGALGLSPIAGAETIAGCRRCRKPDVSRRYPAARGVGAGCHRLGRIVQRLRDFVGENVTGGPNHCVDLRLERHARGVDRFDSHGGFSKLPAGAGSRSAHGQRFAGPATRR